MVDRRGFVRLALAAMLGALIAARAQPATKMRRIGVLFPGDGPPLKEDDLQDLLQPLQQLGWVEGRNIVFEPRFTPVRLDRLTAAAEEMVQRKVDMIFTNGTPATLAAKHATTAIPIVMWSAADPVGSGLVASLNHPGGNITGYSLFGPEMAAKRAALVHELLPAVRRVAVLIAPKEVYPGVDMRSLTDAAYRPLGVETIFIEVIESPNENALGEAVREAVRQQAQALETQLLSWKSRATVVKAALGYRLPVVAQGGDWAMMDAGALLSFTSNGEDRNRRVAAIIDKILRGANPGDIPVEQPTRYYLGINMKSAKALGITVPRSLLLQADEVIR